MSNHYGDFHVWQSAYGIEINSVTHPNRWVVIPLDIWAELVDGYGQPAFIDQCRMTSAAPRTE